MLALFAASALAVFAPAHAAESCDQLRIRVRNELSTRLLLDSRRALTRTVQSMLTPAETVEFSTLSARFNSLSNDRGGLAERIALQDRARTLTRTATAHAGLRVLNPAQDSPFDAVVEEDDSPDGMQTVVELRSLLVMRDPRPHVTIWLLRQDSAHNPWGLVTLGLCADPAGDYASWRENGGPRVAGTLAAFIETRLPAACR